MSAYTAESTAIAPPVLAPADLPSCAIPPPRYSRGQTVVFVNDYGVNWGMKEIVAHRHDEIRGHVYHIAPDDSPWFATSESNLFVPGDPAIAVAEAERPPLYRPDGLQWHTRCDERVTTHAAAPSDRAIQVPADAVGLHRHRPDRPPKGGIPVGDRTA